MRVKLVFCHRSPERTFKIGNRYFPVCARCTGIYGGILVFLVISYFIIFQYGIFSLLVAIVMILPTLLDGYSQLLGYRLSNNGLRFFTGFVSGIGIIILIKFLVNFF